MFHHAQGFPQYAIMNSYEAEELEFKKHVKPVLISDIPPDANVISSHTVYKIKMEENNQLRLKARIAPHGNEDSMKDQLKTDCCMCSPIGIRIILTIATIMKWAIARADAKAAFMKTGRAERDVYVKPPRESLDKMYYWLLLVSAYGLVNSNAKWQHHSDEVMFNIGLQHLSVIAQLFYQMKDGKLALIVIKIVDYLLMTGEKSYMDNFIRQFNDKFQFGTVIHGPGILKFFGLTIIQNTDFSCTVHGDEKLMALEVFPLPRTRRRQPDSELSDYEKSSYMSVNSSLSWLGITASPLCAFISSYLQQKLPDLNVDSIISQCKYLRLLKSYGTSIHYPVPPKSGCHNISILVFSDAGRVIDRGQLSFFAGLLIGPFAQDSQFYVLSWSSHKSKRPVKSVGAAEILAASEAIDEGKVLKQALSTLLGIPLRLIIALDSLDLFTALSTQKNSIDKSIRADVNVIRYEYETQHADDMIWIPGRVNLTDPGTKTDSPLTQAMIQTMACGKLSIDLSEAEARSSDRSLG